MKTPRRRSLVTSVRVALVSGAAAVGWLVVGATGAHAADGLPDLPVPAASVVAGSVSGTAEDVLPAGQQVVPSAAPPVAAAAAVALEETLPVEPVVGLLDQLVDAAPSTLEPVTSAVGEAVAVEPARGLLDQPVQTVLRVIEPVTDAVEQALPTDDLVPVAPVPAAVVDNVLPGGPAAEEILRAEPVTGPVVSAPTVIAATPDASVASPERPADLVPGPELMVQDVTAATPGVAVAAEDQQPVVPRTNPSSSDFLAGLGQSLAAPTSSAAPTLTTSPLPVGTSPAATSGLAGPGATASATGSGGTGTPLRGAGPDSWPEVPADLPYFELFGHLRAGQNDLLSEGVDQPPAPPVFDPGSTPD